MSPQGLVDGERIGVEVEQPAHPRDEHGQIAEVCQTCVQAHAVVGADAYLEPGRASGKPQRAGEGCVVGDFDADDGARGHPREESGGVERSAVGQHEIDRSCDRLARARATPTGAQVERRHPEHLAHRVVELSHAREARREGDVGGGHVGAHEEHARRVRAVRSTEREGTGAELGGEEPREVTRRVAEAAREARHALTFDDAVGDQTHRPAGHVAPQVPLRRARRGLGEAALARAESRLVRRRRRGVEGHVRLLRRARRAARAAIDARGPHGGDELPVEATIAGPDDAIPLVEGHHGDARRRPAHVSTLPRPNAAHSRKSAITVRG